MRIQRRWLTGCGAKSPATGLLAAQEKFAQAVAAGKSQADAYREAYPASRQWKPESVHQQASRLANTRKVAARISVLREEIERAAIRRAGIERADVVQELACIAFTDVLSLFDAHGRLKPIHELTPSERACVASIASGTRTAANGVTHKFEKVRLWNKLDALDRLAKYVGLYSDDSTRATSALARLPREVRDLILAKLDELESESKD